MNKSISYITRGNFIICFLVLIIYAGIRISNNLINPIPPVGDETGFISAFETFVNNGFYITNVQGNSTVYNIISYPFYLITDNTLLSLRLGTLFTGILTFVVLWRFQKKHFKLLNSYTYLALVTSLNVVVVSSIVFFGINDIVLVLLTVLFFNSVFNLYKGSVKSVYKHFTALGIILGLFISTRLMSVVIYPSIIFVLLIVLRKLHMNFYNSLKKLALMTVVFLVTILLFNFPSIIENQNLSFHKKETGFDGVNWTQMQYLSAIGQEKGEIAHNKHYSWEQVKEYLVLNGDDSLPKTMSEALLFDKERTVKEFFIDLYLLIYPFTRLLGVLFLVGVVVFLTKIRTKGFYRKVLKNELFMFFVIYVSIISFIIISNVETRWFINILILIPLLVLNKLPDEIVVKKKTIPLRTIFINLQLLSMIIMNVPFILKNLF